MPIASRLRDLPGRSRKGNGTGRRGRLPGHPVLTDERTVAFFRELQLADDAVAAVLTELDGLAREVERVGARTVELKIARERLPHERAGARAVAREATPEAAERHETAARAQADLERATGDQVAAAERAVTRARDAARMGERRLEAARADETRLVAEAARAKEETEELAARAGELARTLRERSGLAKQAGREPGSDLVSVEAWATDARAALFVARGQLAAQREALIRQANELGTAVLGESLPASSAAVVARLVEQISSADPS